MYFLFIPFCVSQAQQLVLRIKELGMSDNWAESLTLKYIISKDFMQFQITLTRLAI